MEDIVNEFSNLGYKVVTKILNSKDFGVPQSRDRLFYIGLKNSDFKFPALVNPSSSNASAIGTNPPSIY